MPILPDYERILDNARRLSKENKSFLDKLKKDKPSDLDITTNNFHDEAFTKIDCLKCANYCSTTGPIIKNRDISTLSSHLKKRESVFTEQFIRTDEDGDYVFKTLPCPFLGDDNYCSVYSARPVACRDYPHTQQRNIAQKMPITFLNSMICPAVAVVVEKLKEHYSK